MKIKKRVKKELETDRMLQLKMACVLKEVLINNIYTILDMPEFKTAIIMTELNKIGWRNRLIPYILNSFTAYVDSDFNKD